MAPKNNDTLIWVVLGIGGLYLLSQNDDDSKKTISVTVNTPAQDFGGGRVGGEEHVTSMEEVEEPSEFKDEAKVVKKEAPPQQNQFHVQFIAVVDEMKRLDREVSEVFRKYSSRRGQNLGELGVGLREEMLKQQQQMTTLCANIERLLREPGFASTREGHDVQVELQNIRKMSKNFERALNRSELNSRENTANLTADVFLRMYVDVARSLRDTSLNQQFLQADPIAMREFHSGAHDNPSFDVGRPETQGLSQNEIEQNTTRLTYGGKRKKTKVDQDPTDDTRDTIGEAENRDQEMPNTTILLPNEGTGFTGGGVSQKNKGKNKRDRANRKHPKKIDLPRVRENFDTAPPESNTAVSAGAATTTTINTTQARANAAIRQALKCTQADSKKGFQKPVSVKPKASKSGKGKGKKGKHTGLNSPETGGSVEKAFSSAVKPPAPVRKPKTQIKGEGAFDAFYKEATEGILLEGQQPAVDVIYAKLKDRWQAARKAYQVWVGAKDRGDKQEARYKKVAAQTLHRIAEKELVNLEFLTSHQGKLYEVAKPYYDAGNNNPIPRNVERAEMEFKNKMSFGPHNAKSAAVVWAAFTWIWNDLDTWIGQMGGKLKFTLKPNLHADAAVQPRKKKVKKAQKTQGGNRRMLGHLIQEIPKPDRVPEPTMYGRGNPSSLDFGLNPLE